MPWAKSLMTPVDGHAPALDHHPGLAGRDHDRRVAGARGRPRRSSSATDILPIAQSVPTVRMTRLPGQVPPADGRLHPVRRPPVVDDARAGAPAAAGELRVVAEERVQAGVDVEAGVDGRRG